MKTPEEIQELKKQWSQDPCWDIEDAEGFQEHRAELKAWREQYDAQRQSERDKRDQAHADAQGLPLDVYRKIEAEKEWSAHNRHRAADGLVHYLREAAGGNYRGLSDADCETEIRCIVADIITASVQQATAKAMQMIAELQRACDDKIAALAPAPSSEVCERFCSDYGGVWVQNVNRPDECPTCKSKNVSEHQEPDETFSVCLECGIGCKVYNEGILKGEWVHWPEVSELHTPISDHSPLPFPPEVKDRLTEKQLKAVSSALIDLRFRLEPLGNLEFMLAQYYLSGSTHRFVVAVDGYGDLARKIRGVANDQRFILLRDDVELFVYGGDFLKKQASSCTSCGYPEVFFKTRCGSCDYPNDVYPEPPEETCNNCGHPWDVSQVKICPGCEGQVLSDGE